VYVLEGKKQSLESSQIPDGYLLKRQKRDMLDFEREKERGTKGDFEKERGTERR
jgi:hypothetical protein